MCQIDLGAKGDYLNHEKYQKGLHPVGGLRLPKVLKNMI
jgi:hypothetical protein